MQLRQPTDALSRAVAGLAGGSNPPPGVCLGVSVDGAVTVATHGLAQAFDAHGPVDAPAPAMDAQTRVDVGSVTKILVTTLGLMTLLDAGELTLEHRLDDLLAWTAGSPVAGATVGQLLEHQAGLWEWWPLYLVSGSREAALAALARLPLRYAPGSGRHYSDLGFILLGEVVAKLSGMPLERAAAELVLGPRGLADTTYGTPAPGAPVAASSIGDAIEREMVRTGVPHPVGLGLGDDALAFAGWREHVLVGEVNDGNAFHVLGSVSGHAGLFSTTTDLLRAGDGLLASLADSTRLRRATVRRFLTAGADPAQGLGFRRWRIDGEEAWGHPGFPGVALAIIPRLGASVVLATNRLHVRGTPQLIEPMLESALGAALAHLRDTTSPPPKGGHTP